MRNVSDKRCKGNQNTHFVFSNFFPQEVVLVYEIIWKDIVERGRPQITIWRMRIACWIPKATDTHSEYVILYCFTTATVVARTRLNATLYVHCLSCFRSRSSSAPKHICHCGTPFPLLLLLTNHSIPITVLWPLCSFLFYYHDLCPHPHNSSFCNDSSFYTFSFLTLAASAITAVERKAAVILSPSSLCYKQERRGFDSR